MADQDPQREAREWFQRLGRARVTTAEVGAFSRWRDDPANDAAYTALELGLEGGARYVVRPMTERYRVIDQWTGLVVETDGVRHADLDERTARLQAISMNART
jgi:hypothetical protein